MAVNRRDFLRAGSIAAIGVATVPPVKLFGDTHETTKAEVAAHETEPVPKDVSRWAMVIDLRKCQEEKGCTKCIDACNDTHNVPEFDNPKDEIKWIWKESFHHAFHENDHKYIDEHLKHAPALLLCNHCDEPPCTQVCPTEATWKREKDGIVMMDWHRCIGCRYCIAACPYGSRSFNYRDPRPHIKGLNPDFPTRQRGVVEKCTFCEERIAKGKLPSCVEACPVGAMAFGDLEDPHSKVREMLEGAFSIRRKAALGTQPQVYYIV